MFAEDVIVPTGALPGAIFKKLVGDWNSVFRRFSRWSIKGVWWRIFEALSDDPDFEHVIVDSTIVRAHQHVTGAEKGSEDQTLGRSRGGLSKHQCTYGRSRLGMSRAVHADRSKKGDALQAAALPRD